MSIPCPQRDAIEDVLLRGGYDPDSRRTLEAPPTVSESGSNRLLHLLGVSRGTSMRGRWQWTDVAVYGTQPSTNVASRVVRVAAAVVLQTEEGARCQICLLAFDESDRVTLTDYASFYVAIA